MAPPRDDVRDSTMSTEGNCQIPQPNLGPISPIQALKQSQQQQPELFLLNPG